jgi:hypothetical protein
MMDAWTAEIDAAERNNEPGVFTAFAGWEWRSDRGGRTRDRIVFSPAPPAMLKAFFPISSFDGQNPEELWDWLEKTSVATGAHFIAIPHNSNMSDGAMFGENDSDGRPLTAAEARLRAKWEPGAEVTQTKGTSEAHPAISPEDSFADFEIFRRLLFAKEPTPNQGDYIRSALLRGLQIEARTGVNPYKVAMVGGSDVRTGLCQIDENDFGGAVARNVLPEARAAAAASERPPNASASLDAWDLSASGLTGVWATENTREAIAEAFERREVYATTGPRITLQVFASFNFYLADARAHDIAAVGYARGTSMGGDLGPAPEGGRPRLLIHTTKDSAGANLDRAQVIKGWLSADGQTHERVYDAVWSGDRQVGADGKLPPVGDTVDVGTATYKNSIGAEELSVVWEDPDFNPHEAAFYYVRVLEIPTPRQQVFDAVALGMKPEDIPMPTEIQERAFSSPIWYEPGSD